MNTHFCRICGLYNDDFPWGIDGKTPSYEFCSCCGVEFGNEDYTIESVRKYRLNWGKNGFKWFRPNEKPQDWDIGGQLKNIPKEFQ